MRCELCSARVEERGGEVLLVGCLYVLNMVQVILPPSLCFSFPLSIGQMIFSVIYQKKTELALMLCRLLDASKEDYKFLPTLSHAFQQKTCQGIRSGVQLVKLI